MEDCSKANNQSNKIKTTNEIVDLPEEIIGVILFKLPVKSLLKFRCVSKWWFSLISSPEFVKAHLEFSRRNADFTNHRIIFTLANKTFNLKQYPVTSLMIEGPRIEPIADYPSKFPYGYARVLGSCNGIICIDIDVRNIFLWNPATRKFKALPSVDVERTPEKNVDCMWGFGYSESEDDYKIVGTFHESKAKEAMVKIYSLRTDSWKSIESFKYGIPLGDTPRFASGKLHFVARSSMENYTTWNIVSLDLNSESYAIVEQPNYEYDCCSFSLGLLGGCLSITCDYQTTRVDVWVMKEYGVNESWTRVVSIPYFNDSRIRKYLCNPPLIMPNGEVLFFFRPCLLLYNPSLVYPPQISNYSDLLRAGIYFESLVPL